MPWELLALAVGLGADAMSVCIAIGVRWHGPRQTFRMAWHMGLFQALMPVLGWFAGSHLAGVLQGVGTYIASALVLAIAVKMLYEALKSHPGATAEHAADWEQKHLHAKDPTRGWSLVGLALATSIDALVVGVSLGLRGDNIWSAAAIIGLVAGAMAWSGVFIGKRIGTAIGRPAEIAGGVVLVLLAISFLLW